jgi:glyoxylase-like metal-dependent hydrolase (beta-lactamase superfamily II)
VAREVTLGPLRALEMYRAFAGQPIMKVYSFALGDTLIDTGLASLGDRVVAWARSLGATRAVLTHHHEDHAGNTSALLAAGFDVRATETTATLVDAGLPIPFYEHLAWGKPPPARPRLLEPVLDVGGRRVEVIAAPGHCIDQVCFWLPDEGWLFSGDVFLHERVRLFRRDEDFAVTMQTLERLCALPIQSLWCAHRPRVEDGGAALRSKLQHLRDLEGEVRRKHAQGWSIRRIARSLSVSGSIGMELLTFGDATTENLVRSILFGPRPRDEVRRRLAGG